MFSSKLTRALGLIPALLVAALLSQFLPGCSVIEDRDDCPSVLILDLDQVRRDSVAAGGLLLLVHGESLEFADTLASDEIPQVYRLALPRLERLVLDLYPLQLSENIDLSGIAIDQGAQCPEVWSYDETFSSMGESVKLKACLHKNFCDLTVALVSADGKTRWPFSMAIGGSVSGYEFGGASRRGDFRVRMRPDSSNHCFVRVPRQLDNSLVLEVRGEEGALRTFALGEYLGESGYDWTAPDLEDAFIEVNYSATSITFKIDAWSRTISYETVI